MRNKISKYAKYHINPINFQVDKIAIPGHIPVPPWLNSKQPSSLYDSTSVSIIETQDDLKGIRIAGKLAAKALRKAVELSKIHKTGHDLDIELTNFIIDQGAYPSGIGFQGFPKSICISPNDVLVHGIPNKYEFRPGDFINLDVTIYKNGFYGDNSTMVTIGEVEPEIKHLVAS